MNDKICKNGLKVHISEPQVYNHDYSEDIKAIFKDFNYQRRLRMKQINKEKLSKTIQVRLPQSVFNRLNEICIKRKITISQLIREIIEKHLKGVKQ